MKRGFIALFAFLIWFIGTNHCALEAALHLPCTCGDSQSTPSENSKTCNGAPCLTAALSSTSNIQIAPLAQPDLNLQLVSFLLVRLSNFDLKPNDATIAALTSNFNSNSSRQITSLVAASNAPPASSRI